MSGSLTIQQTIAQALNVCPPFKTEQALTTELRRRIQFLKDSLKQSGLKVYVLGISGGVDSLTAGMMTQQAITELREETQDSGYRFIAVRLPYKQQADEAEAMQSIEVIKPDVCEIINIAPSVEGMVSSVSALQTVVEAKRDFVIGNIKARERMVAQYAVAGAYNGLVIGTDHAAEAVMGFYTKFGDGAFDIGPLIGLVKNQVRAFAHHLGAPDSLVNKTPTADLEDLKPGLPDEVAHGVSYEDIDAFLQGESISPDAFNKIVDTYNKSMHKRKLPIGP